MSTRKRLEALTADLVLPKAASPDATAGQGGTPGEVRFPPATPGVVAPKTGPGQMMAFRGQQQALHNEIAELKARLAHHDNSIPTRKLDPQLVLPGRWANRHPDSFSTPDFERLKTDIEIAGGNVQPILVRPLEGTEGKYEIVFGHRRHQACLQLRLEVLAVIWTTPMSDAEFFAAMDRENRERADLSPYEHGMMYAKALEDHLYPSQRRLAEALGVSHTWVQKVLTIAQLPPAVVASFRSPLEVQHRHAERISAALEEDRRGVLRRAEKLAGQRLPATAVVAQLVGQDKQGRAAKEIRVGGQVIGTWGRDGKGALAIRLKPGVIAEERIEALIGELAEKLIAGNPVATK